MVVGSIRPSLYVTNERFQLRNNCSILPDDATADAILLLMSSGGIYFLLLLENAKNYTRT